MREIKGNSRSGDFLPGRKGQKTEAPAANLLKKCIFAESLTNPQPSETMKEFFLKHRLYLLLCSFSLLAGSLWVIVMPKGAAVLALNRLHSPFNDFIFTKLTRLAEPEFAAIALIVLLLLSFRKALIAVLACVPAVLVTQLLKRKIFYESYRPVIFFSDRINELQLTPGVEPLELYSFPSGHTTMAFAFFGVLALLFPNKIFSLLFFSLALFTGISRAYLVLHFAEDILAGAFIGTFWAVLSAKFFEKKLLTQSMQKGLIALTGRLINKTQNS